MCKVDGCSSQIRARGLCVRHWNLEQYGSCKNGCVAPAAGKHGLCSNCRFQRSGSPPSRRNIGRYLSDNANTYCSSCATVKGKDSFTSHKYRCNECQSSRKKRSSASARKKIIQFNMENVLQTSVGLFVKCFKKMDEINIDHIFPISKGGRDIMENYQIMCRKCNQGKGNRDCIDYRIPLTH